MLNIDTLKELITVSAILVPIVTGLVQAIKSAFALTTARFIPIIAIAIGVAAGLVVIETSVLGGIVGLVVGLGSVGLYEFGKSTIPDKTVFNG